MYELEVLVGAVETATPDRMPYIQAKATILLAMQIERLIETLDSIAAGDGTLSISIAGWPGGKDLNV